MNKRLIEAMKKILENPKKSEPICHQPSFEYKWKGYKVMSKLGNEFQALVKRHIKDWPKANDDGSHWIPSSNSKISADEQYKYCREIGNFWRGHQGDLRREALEFLIEKAEQELTCEKVAA